MEQLVHRRCKLEGSEILIGKVVSRLLSYLFFSGVAYLIYYNRRKLNKGMKDFYLEMENGNHVKAENELDRHLSKHPRDEVALLYKAKYQYNRGEVDETVKTLKRANSSHAEFPDSRFMLGKVYIDQADYERAKSVIETGLSIRRTDYGEYLLANAEFGLENVSASKKLFKRLSKSSDYKKEALLKLVEIYTEIGDHVEAEKYHAKLTEIEY